MVNETGLSKAAALVWQKRRSVISVGFAAVSAFLVYASTIGQKYTVNTSFVAVTKKTGGSINNLAAQVGIPLPNAEPSQSPQFYAELVRSEELLRQLSMRKVSVSRGGVREIAALVLRREVRDSADFEDAVEWLSEHVASSASQRTGVVSITVTSRSAELSYAIATELNKVLDSFNQATRNSQAAAERRFTEQRVKETQAELRAAEDDLQAFLARNRIVVSSPELIFQRERLQREVSLRQQVYSTLVQSHEQARIEEVRDTPAITVLQPARQPASADRAHFAARGLLVFVSGMALMSAAVLYSAGMFRGLFALLLAESK